MINLIGNIDITDDIISYASTVRMANYKVNTPSKFYKDVGSLRHPFSVALASILKCPLSKLNWVLFSAASGAEEHTDDLDVDKYGVLTYIIPVILPKGDNILTTDESRVVSLGSIYEINHQEPHAFEVSGDTGCVLIMASIMRG